MRRLSLLVLCLGVLTFGLLGCSDKKKPAAEEPEVATCETNADCAQGEVCLANECASAAPGAIYTNPSTAVTPAKVKSHVEQVNEKAQKRADDLLEAAE
jgi:hypothetical protein